MEEIVPTRERHAKILQRKCAACGVVKPLNEECFDRKVTKKSGFRGVCKKCRRKSE